MRNIKEIILWIYMLTKRCYRKPLFILSLFAIPCLVMALRTFGGTDESILKVALYAETEESNELAIDTINALVENSNGTVKFYKVDSSNTVVNQVKRGEVVCGYVFPEHFEDAVATYVEKGGGVIRCIRSDDSNIAKIADEIVFAAFYETFAGELLENFMKNVNPDTAGKMTDADFNLLDSFYQSYDITSDFFTFETADGKRNDVLSSDKSFLLLSIRGLILTFVLLASLTGNVMLYKDKEQGVFQSIPGQKKFVFGILYTAVPAIHAAVFGLAGILMSGLAYGLTAEIRNMIIYVPVVIVAGVIMKQIYKNVDAYIAVIPFYILANILFCPVFLDVTAYVHELKIIQYILPVYYGLMLGP